jgi:hypothetical protein
MLSTCARILKQYISTNTNAWWHECNKTFDLIYDYKMILISQKFEFSMCDKPTIGLS